MSARFGDQLREKRRSLGLSIQQVSNTVKIRPQIVEYFELGDFASMPPRGYAQGMISSYARFLGLNPREIVNQYLDELYVYERSGEGTQQRYQDPASFVSSRSDASSGRFMIVDGGAPSSSRYAQRPPQAGYVSDSTTGHSSLRVGSNPRRRQALLADSSSREQGAQQMPEGPDGRQRPRQRRDSSSRPSGARNRRSQAPSNRRLPEGGRSRQGQYQRGRANGGSLGPARRSGGYGRSRTNVPQRRGQGRGRSASASFLSSMDPRMFWAGAGIVLLLIVFLIIGAVRGCTSPSTQTTTVPQSAGSASTSSSSSSTKKSASSTSSKSSSSSADDTADDDDATTDSTASDSTDASDSDSSTGGTSSTDQTTVRDTTVKVSLAKGKTSWIEVKVDGVSQYADTPVGPYEAEYTPTKSISITVDNPSAVTVTENGSKVRWDSKTSGVGRVTITVPQQTADSSADSSSDDTQSDSSSDSADDQGDSSTD